MKLRTRLTLTFALCLLLACSGVTIISYSQTRQASINSFQQLAESQLERVEEHIMTFIEPGKMAVSHLATLDIIKNSRGMLTSYLDTYETTTLLYKNHTPYEKEIYDEFMRAYTYNNNFDLVFMANSDSQYTQTPEGRIKNAGYDPRLRSWYIEAIENTNEVTITTPYITTGAGMVCSILAKTYDSNGEHLGLIGIDYLLQSLTEDLATRQILETGYIVLFDGSGNIIFDRAHPELFTAERKDYPELRRQMAESPDSAFLGQDSDGTAQYIVTRQMKDTGWVISVVFEQAELMKSTYETLWSNLFAFALVFALLMFMVRFLSRSLVMPIESLTDAAEQIANGDYEISNGADLDLHHKLNIGGSVENRRLGEALGHMLTALQSRIESAVAASNAKSYFLSNMSHEMRTPMNAIIGMTNIGKTAESISRKNYAFEKIEEASVHLLGVINDVLDMSKIEADMMELYEAEFHFEKMLQRSVGIVNFRIEEKKQAFTVWIDPEIPAGLIGDEQRLSQVVTNLLSNAIKFTPEEGTIHLSALMQRCEDGICTLRINIEDSGIGISEEQQQRLFASFVQAETSTARRFGGTGLGLSISKHIIEMMGGSIWIESQPGHGSQFLFEVNLPLPEGALPDPHIESISAMLLLLDSSARSLQCFEQHSLHYGLELDTAGTVSEAVELSWQKHYDLIFIDWKTADPDGIALVRRLKQMDMASNIVVMMSPAEWVATENEISDDYIMRYLPKPLFPSMLEECLMAYKTATEQGTLVEPTSAGEDASKFTYEGRRILMAEDIELNREIVLALLEPTRISIDCAVNGKEAFDMYTATPSHYELIFMDIQMPEMDGLETTPRIREWEASHSFPGVPIIAMTANAFREDVEKCLEVGMNAHISKPVDYEKLLEKLAEYLSR